MLTVMIMVMTMVGPMLPLALVLAFYSVSYTTLPALSAFAPAAVGAASIHHSSCTRKPAGSPAACATNLFSGEWGGRIGGEPICETGARVLNVLNLCRLSTTTCKGTRGENHAQCSTYISFLLRL